MIGGSICAVVLLVLGSLSNVVGCQSVKTSVDNNSVELSLETSRFDNESIHHFCFVQAGYVDIRHVSIRGFWLAYYSNFFFCIDEIELDLKSFDFEPDEPRLIVKSLFGKTIYENNISVSLNGFIGSVRPTGSVDPGHLKGFTRIAYITPLENQYY